MPDTDRRYRLSPWCVFHAAPDAPELVVTHALYGSRFRVSGELLDAMARLLAGASRRELEARPGLREALDALIEERVLVEAGELEAQGGAALFHNRLDPIALALQRAFNEGGFLGEEDLVGPPPPIRKRVPGLEEIPLALHPEDDGPGDLAACLRRRRSRRHFSERPLARKDFERLLQLAARMQSVQAAPGLGEVGFRAHPSGGGRQPLEIYPVVRNVESLAAGFYHYDAFDHRLARLPDHPEAREALFGVVERGLGAPALSTGEPAVLLAITAVFARTCWKYRGIPYALILQEVGALYQTLYLVATRLGLAPCAVGAFPERAVGELLGLDPRDEAQVGLFALGVPAD